MFIAVAGCDVVAPITDYRGYLPRGEEIQRIQIGMGKTEIEALLGSPSTTATIEDLGESYYYISSVVETRAFLAPEVTDREILAVRFDADQRVSGLAHYGLEDGKIIDFITRETPTRGKEYTILQQLFDNIGRFQPGAS
jgi:outer membrane protein assembly factor BamE (lipoprotein component of BamABCDE complex)